MSSISSVLARNGQFAIGQNVSSGCSSPNFEVFESSDEIKTFLDIRPYLLFCGSSTASIFINSVDVLATNNSNNIFLVSYCCFPEYELSHEICYASWSTDCDQSNNTLSLDFQCVNPNINTPPRPLNAWYFNSNLNKLFFNIRYNSCSLGCEESTVSNFSPDVSDAYAHCPATPSDLPTVTPTPHPTPTIVDAIDLLDTVSPVHIAGDLPYHANEVCYGAFSEVLTKPNSTDSSFKTFYFLTTNGYFFESLEAVLVESFDSNSLSLSDGSSIFYLADELSSYRSLFSLLSPEEALDFISFYDFYSTSDIKNILPACPIVIDNNYTPTTTQTIDTQSFVKDESLISKTFDLSGVTITPFGFKEKSSYQQPIASLNDYWFTDLIDDLYPNSKPTSGEYQPTCSITQNNYIFSDTFSFDPVSYSASTSSREEIYLRTPSANGWQYQSYAFDPVYNVNNLIKTFSIDLELLFNLEINTALVTSSYNGPETITRKEKFTIFLKPHLGTTHISENISLEPFSVDCTDGLTNLTYNISKGFGIRVS